MFQLTQRTPPLSYRHQHELGLVSLQYPVKILHEVSERNPHVEATGGHTPTFTWADSTVDEAYAAPQTRAEPRMIRVTKQSVFSQLKHFEGGSLEATERDLFDA